MDRSAFEKKLKESKIPIVVDFWAPWCVPCQVTVPILQKLAQTYTGRVEFLQINADDEPELARSYNVMAIPTLVIFQNGEEATRHIGAKPAQIYSNLFESLAQGQSVQKSIMAPLDRALRLLSGAVLGWLGFSQGNWLVLGLGIILALLGVYDLLPFWESLASMARKRLTKS